jgi:catechol 2,3-dioxygenase-like lactoylglutathione lyase family enzyme
MVGYVTLGTRDFDAAVAFYDAVFAAAGVQRLWTHGGMAAWARARADVALCVTAPFDRRPASAGNGSMVALRMENRAQVDAVHAAALAAGGSDEGAPGPRGDHGFYGGYFRDLDGNKLNAYVSG